MIQITLSEYEEYADLLVDRIKEYKQLINKMQEQVESIERINMYSEIQQQDFTKWYRMQCKIRNLGGVYATSLKVKEIGELLAGVPSYRYKEIIDKVIKEVE